MKSKITSFLSFLGKPNKKAIGALLFFLILGLTIPLHPAQAYLTEAVLGGMLAFASYFLAIPIAISFAILGLASLILAWVTSPHFIGLSYTTNDFVMLGWTLTRDLANMFFIIVLVVIGLATALRRGDYGAKKALPLLILIALLINFTPVITGLIIDASNIVMRFFLAEGTGLDLFVAGLNTIKGSVASELKELDLKDIWGVALLTLISPFFLIIFNLLAAAMLFLFAALFIMRYVAIWMLVILSPIAFLFYILPATKKYFNLWWDQFIQWCLIGVTAAFFLYLSNQLAAIIGKGGFVLEPEGLGLLAPIMPLMIVLGFLIFGFFATLSISAGGASQIIAGTKKGGKWAARKGYVGAQRKLREWGGKTAERIRGIEPVKGILEKPRVRAGMEWAKRRKEEVEKVIPPMRIPGVPTPLEEKIEIEKVSGKYLKEAKAIAAKGEEEVKELLASARKGSAIPQDLQTTDQKGKRLAQIKAALNAMPGYADEARKFMPKIASTEEIVQKMNPEQFRKNIHPKGITPDVYMAMGNEQFKEIQKKGSVAQKNALEEPIKKEIKRLEKKGKIKEAGVLAKKMLIFKEIKKELVGPSVSVKKPSVSKEIKDDYREPIK